MRLLWPMMTHGTPGSDTPVTFKPGALRCTVYQIAGTLNSRCGSLASIGFPLAVCLPAIAQAFEPGWFSVMRFGYAWKPEPARIAVRFQPDCSKNLGEIARGGTAHCVHLPQAVLRRDVALQEDRVLPIARRDVRYAERVARNAGLLRDG